MRKKSTAIFIGMILLVSILYYSQYKISNKTPSDNVEIDSDGDGIVDALDLCPNTLSGSIVDLNGCKETLRFSNFSAKPRGRASRNSLD